MTQLNGYSSYLACRYFTSLHGLRAISIIVVLWHHTVTAIPQLPITSRGFLGVDMFFVISGFLIVTLVLRERDRTGDIGLRNFYMRRTLRIFPIYYTLLAVLAGLFFLITDGGEQGAQFRQQFPFYITYTSNWVHDVSILAVTWSLATEEQFYLVWPPIEKFLKGLAIPIIVVFILFNQLINFGVIFTEQHALLEILQITFTPIAFGVLLAHLLHRKNGFNFVSRTLGGWYTPLIIGVVLIFVINLPKFGADISGFPRLAIHVLMTLLLASCVVGNAHILTKPFNHPFIIRIGAVSYGMYLYHMLVRYVGYALLERLGTQVPLALFAFVFIVTYVVSELSFRFYETPFLKLKERWSSHVTPSNLSPKK